MSSLVSPAISKSSFCLGAVSSKSIIVAYDDPTSLQSSRASRRWYLQCPGRDSNPSEAMKNFCQVVRLPHIASFLQEFSSRPGQPSTAASEPKPRWRAALGQHESSPALGLGAGPAASRYHIVHEMGLEPIRPFSDQRILGPCPAFGLSRGKFPKTLSPSEKHRPLVSAPARCCPPNYVPFT